MLGSVPTHHHDEYVTNESLILSIGSPPWKFRDLVEAVHFPDQALRQRSVTDKEGFVLEMSLLQLSYVLNQLTHHYTCPRIAVVVSNRNARIANP